MVDGDGKEKKGFAGLVDLASKVSGIDELPVVSEPKAPPRPSTLAHSGTPSRSSASSQPQQKAAKPAPPANTSSSHAGRWILGIAFVVFILWLINSGNQSYTPASLSSTSPSPNHSGSGPAVQPTPPAAYSGSGGSTDSITPPSAQFGGSRAANRVPPRHAQSYGSLGGSPAVPVKPQPAGLQYTKPPVGTNNVLSVAQLRWCVREGIRIEAMRGVIDTNEGVNAFNQIVNNYNTRCGQFEYYRGTKAQAEREVGVYRNQIVSQALREARQFGYATRSPSPVSPATPTNGALGIPSAADIRQAQHLLTYFGYDPGPVDGQYGPQTEAAVKAFERDYGLPPTGRIDQRLLFLLGSGKR